MTKMIHNAHKTRTYGLAMVGLASFFLGLSFSPNYANAKNNSPMVQEGTASWYGGKFHGRKTASGERFNTYDLTAAHRTLPMNTLVKVTNLSNGKSVVVRINDRGPYAGKRVIDLSYSAANELGFVKRGVTKVRLERIPRAEPKIIEENPNPEVYTVMDSPDPAIENAVIQVIQEIDPAPQQQEIEQQDTAPNLTGA
ncbi:MAG: septal ring lytic transglycosylase RlpA family protein [Neisseriaceae bacterium]|nr:septal ring lytic transglycosylase RlpA family protein [Neisseriaceae bacterium]MBR5940029.1 septal ring lytic transglycosylase RlpA family protein [Neisseriaceae bacterium]